MHTMHNRVYNLFSPLPYPSIVHTTVASEMSQRSSHTVPHCPSLHTSTRPSVATLPSTRRIFPCKQTAGKEVVIAMYTHESTKSVKITLIDVKS